MSQRRCGVAEVPGCLRRLTTGQVTHPLGRSEQTAFTIAGLWEFVMADSLSIRGKWSLDEQFGKMLREMESHAKQCADDVFHERLLALLDEYRISGETLLEWQSLGILIDERPGQRLH